MEIHHYTSIENLALILKNKTIRFTRLDKVDDSEEAGLSCKNIQLSYYTFVSCWTDSEEESIPLWKMYAGKEMHGIRISLDSDMFLKYHIPSGRFYGVDVYSKNEKSSILPIEKIVTKDYLVVPSFNDSEMFFKKVLYVDNPFSEMRDVVQIQDMGNGEGAMKMNLKKIGLYKRKCWAFQKEHRFTLTILPNPILKNNLFHSVFPRNIKWKYGSFKSTTKWTSQMNKRGWTESQITEAINMGKKYKAINNVNKGHKASRYVHPKTGRSVVIDDITHELLQVGGNGFKWTD